ncbi:MAG TPA: hypothetical protein VFQ68_10380 [Streptosporangiaceae bacterium]|nr:hypothetical protein [Streptosporangiaceae bacterium]
MLRVLDVRTGSYAEIRPARAGLLRLCAHVPGTAAQTDITWLRVLLAADVLTRAAELQKVQVLTVLAFADEAGAQAAGRAADALGLHPAAASGSLGEVHASPGGPADVHLDSRDERIGDSQGGLVARVGTARLLGAEDRGDAVAAEVLDGPGSDPLPVRLALLSVPCHRPADLAGDMLAGARETIGHWRRQVARWAESPSRPVPAGIMEQVRAACGGLDTVSLLALLRDLVPEGDVPEGAKFETFVYADRVLGLDLPRDIGRAG